MTERKYDLEERLIDFSVMLISFVESLPNSKASLHLGSQILRSGISPSLNYGEAQSADSKNDFVRKMKVCLKELRESKNGLRILFKAKIYRSEEQLIRLINECSELIAIFTASVGTATKRKQ